MRKSIYVMSAIGLVGALALLLFNQFQMHEEMAALRTTIKTANEYSVGPSAAGATPTDERILSIRAALAHGPLGIDSDKSRKADAPSDPPPPKETGTRERSPKPVEQVQANLLRAYANEQSDPSWGRDAARHLQSSISGALPDGSRLLSVDCRTTLCYIELSHRDEATALSWPNDGFNDWPGATMLAGEREESGEIIQTLLAIREGTTPDYDGEKGDAVGN